MPNISRRKVLKGISVAGATAAVPFGLQAAQSVKTKHLTIYIDAKHAQLDGSASSEIVNQGNQPLILPGYEPVTYKNANGEYTTLRLNTLDEAYALQPGERLPVYAKAIMTNSPEKLNIKNKLVSNSIAFV